MRNKLKLYNNPNGFGSRKTILIVLTAPCLEWITRLNIPQGLNVSVLLNRNDCNNPIDFKRRIDRLLRHPNVIGAVIVRMGCESFQISNDYLIELNDYTISSVDLQKIFDELIEIAKNIHNKINTQRIGVSFSKVNISIKCGGSTKDSQETANSFAGTLIDNLIEKGINVIFNEPQETIGLEDLYKERVSEGDYNKWKSFINKLPKNYDESFMNQGNLREGIKNILQKSLGSIKKVGYANFGVYNISEYPINTPGLNQILGTNQEPESMYQMMEYGSILNLYITGHGGLFGTPISPLFSIGKSKFNRSKALDVEVPENINMLRSNEVIDKIIRVLEGELTITEKLNISLT